MGFVLGVLLGVLLSRKPKLSNIVLPVLSVFNTIPGIVFIGLLVLFWGAQSATVLVALPGCLDEDGSIVDMTATESRQVTLGRNDDNYIEILDGLEEGDVVLALSPQGSSLMSAMGME